MSSRSEFFDANYAVSRLPESYFSYEVVTAVSFGLCFAVFAIAVLMILRRPKQLLHEQSMIPFNSPTDLISSSEARREQQ